jgi:malonate transporter MadL subunit
MIIYGTAILAVCHLLGVYLGNARDCTWCSSHVGGVAIAMILLILSKELLAKRGHLPQVTQFMCCTGQVCISRLWLPCRQAKT